MAAAAEIRGVGQHGIDDQRPRVVVARHPKADLLRIVNDKVAALHDGARAVDLLINDRLVLRNVAVCGAQHEITLRGEREIIDAVEAHLYHARIGAGCDHEVVLQLALTAVINHVDAGVDAGVFNACVMRYAGAPMFGVTTDEIVALAGQLVERNGARICLRTQQPHVYGDFRRARRAQVQQHTAGCEQHAVTRAAREKFRGRCIGVVLETEWQIAVASVDVRWARVRRHRRRARREKNGGAQRRRQDYRVNREYSFHGLLLIIATNQSSAPIWRPTARPAC